MRTAEGLFQTTIESELWLRPGELSIGRAADNDIALNEPAISDYHARFITYFHQSYLIDLSSESGSFVNGQRIVRHSLRNGDVVQLGNHQFKIRILSGI